jgi:hypothetical protein
MSQVSDWYRCEQAMRRRRTARFIRPDGSASDTIRLIPRQTDVPDCQWIQYLHSVGLLRGSFRPPDVICAIRSLWRYRDSLIQMAAQHVMHMQKSLDQMNLQLHHVLSEITGLSGQRILDAISIIIPCDRVFRKTGRLRWRP